ncbi:hypothetical protein [Phaffia rhodozyma]|uniref:Uncharacterized protein n=1 Tax=Phaffia rhodozyma TaxID=264483 RepID=A0A0F7SN93_PHARH|nr:hypothetical protein [Phaffia rhodozyma]
MNGLETTNTSSLSRDPTTFLADIFTSSGLTLPARVQAPARSSPVTSPPGHPVYTSSSSDEPAMMESMEIDIPSDSSNPFFMLFETLCQFLPSSLERHLCQISMINPAIILNAGLSSTDTTDWPVESCFEALRRIWGNEHGGWRGSDLGRILQSSESSLSPPHPSFSNDAASAWQTSSTTQSVHAPRKASSLSTQCLAEKDPSGSQTYTPPSASYVRTKILPTQVSFWTDIQTTGKPPSKGQWADIHSGLQILFGGQGGGRFIGPAGHRELQARLKDVRNALDG